MNKITVLNTVILSDIQIRSYTGMIIDLQKYERDLNTSTNKLKSSNWNRFNIIPFRVSEAVKVQTGQQFTKFQMRNKGICKYICKSKARVYVMKNRAQAPSSIKKSLSPNLPNLPPPTEIENEQTEPSTFINFSSFLP